MPKKKVTKQETCKKDKQLEILKKGVYEIFDRTPIGSIVDSEASKLLDEILK